MSFLTVGLLTNELVNIKETAILFGQCMSSINNNVIFNSEIKLLLDTVAGYMFLFAH